jgi:hypothetical protein
MLSVFFIFVLIQAKLKNTRHARRISPLFMGK